VPLSLRFDVEKVAEAIRETADIEVMPRFGKLQGEEVREKAPGNLVTIADEAAERRLAAALTGLLPGSVVVGEESVAADTTVLDRLADETAVWIVDPIDGTGNYCAGRPIFAIMVALARAGETLAGWIYDPVRDEMLTAARGEGAYQNGAPIHVDAGTPLEKMVGMISWRDVPDRRRQNELRKRYMFHGDDGDPRCAGREYVELARGDRHFTTFRHLNAWDHAPGLIIHAEAGGYSALSSGAPYRLHGGNAGSILVAPSRAAWRELHGMIFRS
jgi:fructose-1,6-bisphosphatase/inositol monophosphatase family enzyme